jgi:hypothetical protein
MHLYKTLSTCYGGMTLTLLIRIESAMDSTEPY